MLAVLAAFFCLLFFAAAKKSRCRPAQGRRLKHDNKTRMPAKKTSKPPASQTSKPKGRIKMTDLRSKLKDPSLLQSKAYLNGEWQDADNKETFEVLNTATGELIAQVPRMG